jgi:hypothetical protein
MNGISAVPVPAGLWQEARNADGRVYYYNVQTKATQWHKPLDLMSPLEVRPPLNSVRIFPAVKKLTFLDSVP